MPAGWGFDFGAPPNLFRVGHNDDGKQLLGVGQKSGMYWAPPSLCALAARV
jgi:hypothetical protein